MKIPDLLTKFTDKEILEQLFILYPDEKKNREGYISALNEIRNIKSVKSTMKITVERVFDEEETWVDVCMRRGKEHYSASFTKWNKWLGMNIVADKDFSELAIVAYCLWEMTWYGYSDESTQKKGDEILKMSKKAIKEIKEKELKVN